MTRKLVMPLGGTLFVLLFSSCILLAQAVPEAPEAPGPPPAPLLPAPPALPALAAQKMFFLGDRDGWLGVALSDVSAEKARELKLPGEYGALVTEVEPDSPAAKAGLAKNDVILEFAGERVRSVAQLDRLVRETPAGRTVNLQVNRDGQARSLSAKLEGRGGSFRMPRVEIPRIRIPEHHEFFFETTGATLGITGDDLTRQLADYFGVKQGKGVLVREVLAGSSAEKAGLKAGDVIVRVDGHEVGSVSELRRALPQNLEGERKVELTIVRDRREQALSVQVESTPYHRLRKVENPQYPGLDSERLKNLATEYQRLTNWYQVEMRNLQRELQLQGQRLQKEWQHYSNEYQRQLNEEIHRNTSPRRTVSGENQI